MSAEEKGLSEALAQAGVDLAQLAEDTVVVDSVEIGEKHVSDVEKLASQYGWKPEGERTAEDFIAFALEKLPKRGKELEQMRNTIEQLKNHMTKQEEAAYQRALADLQNQRIEAIRQGDPELVAEIEQRQQQLKPNIELPEVSAFKERHGEWINSPKFEHRQMKQWLEEQDRVLANYNLTPAQHMEELEDSLHKKFPDYFKEGVTKEVVSKSNTVESGNLNNLTTEVTHKNKKYSFNDLNDAQKQAARLFEQMKVMKVDDYIKDLVKSGELK